MKTLSQRWNNMRQIDGKIVHSRCMCVCVACGTDVCLYGCICGGWQRFQLKMLSRDSKTPIDPYTNQCQLTEQN